MGISRGFGLTAGIISSTTTGFLISQVGHVIEHLQLAGIVLGVENTHCALKDGRVGRGKGAWI